MMLRFALISASVLGSAFAAQAEGYSISDLGLMNTKADCMARAERILNQYMNNLGAHSVNASSWTVYGWDLEPGDQDVVITCGSADTSDDTRRAILVVYGSASEVERKATRDVLKGYWNE